MTAFVLDASITLAWLFEDERSEAADELLARLDTETAAVPSVWPLEVANVIAGAERRRRITAARRAEFVAQLETFAIMVDEETADRAFSRILDLARQQQLSAYDAAYLELAMRLGIPLASKDRELRDAAERVGVIVLGAD